MTMAKRRSAKQIAATKKMLAARKKALKSGVARVGKKPKKGSAAAKLFNAQARKAAKRENKKGKDGRRGPRTAKQTAAWNKRIAGMKRVVAKYG
jgi:hypothetical protein